MATNYHIGYPDSDDASILHPPIEQGSTFELAFTITLPQAVMSQFCGGDYTAALDNGTDIQAQYSSDLTATATTADFTCTISKIDNATLYCTITLDSEASAGLPVGKGYWDCEIFNDADPAYVLKPLGSGNKCKVVAEATKYV